MTSATSRENPPEPRSAASHPAIAGYAIALSAASVWMFGRFVVSLIPLLLIVIALVGLRRRGLLDWAAYLLIGLLLALLIDPFHPAVSFSRTPKRAVCKNNLKQIGLALHNYHDVHGSFPPAITYAPDGTPLHSWRTLILPFLDQAPLYNELRLDEPWNSEHNRRFLKECPIIFRCPTEPDQTATTYLAIIDDRSCWPDGGPRSIEDIPDGPSDTLLVIEAAEHHVFWAEPRDLSLAEYQALFAETDIEQVQGHFSEGLLNTKYAGRHGLLSDGSVRQFAAGIVPEFAAQIARIDDGGFENWDPPTSVPHAMTRPNWDNRFRLAVWLTVLLFPAFVSLGRRWRGRTKHAT